MATRVQRLLNSLSKMGVENHSVIRRGYLVAGAISVGLAMLAVGCSAGETEPTHTQAVSSATSLTPTMIPTPTPIAAPANTLAPPRVSAGEACNVMETPFDSLMTGVGLLTGLKVEVRYSGSDEHLVMTQSDPEGVLLGKGEMIFKDNVFYTRESAQDSPEVYGEWLVHLEIDQLSTRPPCPDLEQGDSGHDIPFYSYGRSLSEGEGRVYEEYWAADSTGWPVRARRSFFDESDTETGAMEFTYSGFGEPNTIKAPCASAAPDQADNPGLMRDCILLLNMKDALGGAAVLNWNLDTPIAHWEGLTVEGTPLRVTRIQLPNHGLEGSIPGVPWRLSALTHLDLRDNALSGRISMWTFAELPELQEINLSGNSLEGCIPDSLRSVASNDLSSLNLPDC